MLRASKEGSKEASEKRNGGKRIKANEKRKKGKQASKKESERRSFRREKKQKMMKREHFTTVKLHY